MRTTSTSDLWQADVRVRKTQVSEGGAKADLTRLHILHAAARQFADKPYPLVSLDDILTDAEVTKGALYFHFRSKHALAIAIIEQRWESSRLSVGEVLARRLSGLETLIDISYLVAVEDVCDTIARAGLNLIESIGRADGIGQRIIGSWVDGFTEIGRRALTDGDITADTEPNAVATLLVSMYLGLRQASTLDEPTRLLSDLERNWRLALPGFAEPERLSYFTQFSRRRCALAIRKAAAALGETPATDPRAQSDDAGKETPHGTASAIRGDSTANHRRGR